MFSYVLCISFVVIVHINSACIEMCFKMWSRSSVCIYSIFSFISQRESFGWNSNIWFNFSSSYVCFIHLPLLWRRKRKGKECMCVIHSCFSALFFHVLLLRLLWQSLNVLLSNSTEIPEWRISSHTCCWSLMSVFRWFCSDCHFSSASFYYYYSLIAAAAATTFVHLIIVIGVFIVSVVNSPVRFLLSFLFLYFGMSVRFDNVFYIISISSARGHHHVLCAARARAAAAVVQKTRMNGPISMLEALPIKR